MLEQHVFHRGQPAEQMMRLEDVADVLPAKDVAMGFGKTGDVN